EALNALFVDWAAQAHAALDRDGVGPDDRRIERSVDLRYHGQSHELAIPLGASPLEGGDLGPLREAFHAAHAEAYGYAAREDAIELVNVRLTAVAATRPLHRPHLP